MQSQKIGMNRHGIIITVALACTLLACSRQSSSDSTVRTRQENDAYNKARAQEKARQKARLEWNRNLRRGAYDKVGVRNSAWDAFARRALESQALLVAQTDKSADKLFTDIADATKTAMRSGCQDPLIGYLHARYVVAFSGVSAKEIADAYLLRAAALEPSGYGDVMKFYAQLRAANAVRDSSSWSNRPPEMWASLVSAGQHLLNALEDSEMPVEEVYSTTREIMTTVEGATRTPENFFTNFDRLLTQNWGNTAQTHALRGEFFLNSAWRGRGGGYASTVTEEGWKVFGERLKQAETELGLAWKLDPGLLPTPEIMIRVCMGKGSPRPEMEKWFLRAMDLSPNDYEACKSKLFYLEPKWHGSAEEMIQFGRECVASKWTGTVCLILVDAHDAVARYLPKGGERDAYWLRAEVWTDVKSAYERFFRDNPDGISFRHNYAWYAYKCGQWEAFNQQVKLMGPVNYSYFGGRETFDTMVNTANQKVAGK